MEQYLCEVSENSKGCNSQIYYYLCKMAEIFIAGNVPSSKNGKRWTGKYLIHSKTVMNYIKKTKEDWIKNKENFEKLF